MDYRKVSTTENRGKNIEPTTYIDNFSVKSKPSERPFWEPK